MTIRRSAVAAVFAFVALLIATAGGRALVAVDEPDPDACTKARAEIVGTLITPQPNVEIRPRSGHPSPVESTCLWSAVSPGLTNDAPPDGTLSLAFYHLVSPERAANQMKRLATVRQPPSLVRTADSTDLVLRTDPTTIVTRHGSDIVVVEASETSSLARERAGWAYRLEAMAFAAVGAKVLGPVDSRAIAPVCKLVAPDHVLALLTLSPSTLDGPDDHSDNGLRCYFSVKDASRGFSGRVFNNGNAQVRYEDLGTNAAALERLHSDRPFFKPSTLVATIDPTDRVVATPDHPEEVEAVHGPYVITLNLTGVTPAARGNPTWAYRVQRTALEIAGATIAPNAALPPDPVTPGPAPAPAAFRWRTSGHTAPTWAWLADPFAHVLVLMALHRFLLMPALIGCGVLFAAFGSSKKAPRTSAPAVIRYRADTPSRRSRRWAFTPLLIGVAILNLLLGTWISGLVVYTIGTEGQATVTGSHGTGTVYNSHHVRGYDVLIRTPNGRTIESGFEDDDFNVYPSHNATTYPGKGDEFNVRFLQHFPADFIILGEDDSPWALGLRCSKLGHVRAQAEAKARFAPDVASFREAVAAATDAETKEGCDRVR